MAKDAAEGRVAPGKALAPDQDIWGKAPVVASEGRPRAPKPRHNLIEDEENAVAPAPLGDGWPVALGGTQGAAGGADDGFGDQSCNGLRAFSGEDLIEVCQVMGELGRRIRPSGAAQGIGRFQLGEGGEEGAEARLSCVVPPTAVVAMVVPW